MNDTVTAPTVHETADTDPPQKQVITHMIGDVTVVLLLPQGCPQPQIELNFHRRSPAEATAARDALDLDLAPLEQRDGTRWYQGTTDGGQMTATVFLP